RAEGLVLEIGFGTGLNLPFYSSNVRELMALDPEPELTPFLQSRLEGTNFPTLFVKAFAENIPLQTGSVNTVVSTWTLCVVKDFEKVLQEVRRVLLPNGSLI